MGDEALVAQCIQIAQSHGLEPVLLSTTSPIAREFAVEQGIPVVGPRSELAAGLDEHPADVLFSIANLRVLPAEVLARVTTAVNYHDGPLPGYGGLNVTTWAILAVEDEHAITWHLMTSDVDGGEIVSVERFAIAPDDTAFALNARCYEAALATFPRIAAAVADGSLSTTPQPDGTRRMFRRHDRPALLLDPTAPAAMTARETRALDLGARIANTVGAVRWIVGDEAVVVGAAREIPDRDQAGTTPGAVLAVDAGGVHIATDAGVLAIDRVTTPEGDAVADLGRLGVLPGAVLPPPDPDLVAALAELEPVMAKDEAFWLDRLVAADPTVPALTGPAGGDRAVRTVELPAGTDPAAAVAVVALWLSRTTTSPTVVVGLTDPGSRAVLDRLSPLARPGVAVFHVDPDASFTDLLASVGPEVDEVRRRAPLLRDALGRDPRTRGRAPGAPVTIALDPSGALPVVASDTGSVLHVSIGASALVLDAAIDPDDPSGVDRMVEQLATLLAAAAADPGARCGSLPVIGPVEAALLDDLNRTGLDHDRSTTLDSLFRAQVAATPEAPAISFGDTTLDYRRLAERVDLLAGRLGAAGVGRGDRVGIAVPRGIDMVVGVLATLQVGAAYLPLDPTYPVDRLGFMVDDAGIAALLATGTVATELGRPGTTVIDPSTTPDGPPGPNTVAHQADDLAYVIYTSGSTGLPKGVMLEHRQVTNFFVAMDQVIGHEPPGVWLAVTSLSFDISVLELLWTLTRGFHVVLKADRGIPAGEGIAAPTGAPGPARPVSFSLFYFAAGEEAAGDGYRLLLDSARFADRHGFEAVWTPERHFHAFGGSYPNPSVIGAALAAVTDQVGIRAGSVVLPLHSPIRVAEEWAVVDNLSRGRVSISFAAGWQPDDFVLNPAGYANAKQDLARNMDLVQRLWRGETVAMPGHDGAPVEVRTLPRPVQADLPVWLTSAGTPATFERAGTLGVNVLTHLLGQSVDQLAENIARYRAAWRAAGHGGEGRVTLMMHTYLDRDADTAREVAREPMKQYLGTAVGLLRDVASAFPTFAQRSEGVDDLFASLSEDELDQLLEVAAQRYLGTSGLFGTADDVAATVEAVSAVGVDEVACLIDFGIPTDEVLHSLELLLDAKGQVDRRREETPTDVDPGAPASIDPASDTVAALTSRHAVTHLQCTPSLAAMLLADPADRQALGAVSHLMLGGEALPSALATEVRDLLPGRFTNMYGPTETTIWSLTHELDRPPGPSVPIGDPIANTTIFVLDSAGQRVPIGTFGELHIGGEGVARGYHARAELTAERFVERPGMGRVYATGDVVRVHPAGHVEFAGRSDNQVKIRGHRIELGEIEAVLDRHPAVIQSVVVPRDDHGDIRLIAYVVTEASAASAVAGLREHVADSLPAAMVPSAVVRIDAFPLTPNGKVDRKALQTGALDLRLEGDAVGAPPADDTEALVAGIWADELGLPVGRDDNFFDIGGHSLLAVKVFRRLGEATEAPLALTDVFRFPTVRTFAAHLGTLTGDGSAPAAPAVGGPSGVDRGAMRRRALAGRGRGDRSGR